MINLDNVYLSSLTGAYINYDTPSSNILVTGTIADFDTATFTTSIPYLRDNSIADVYLQSSNGNRMLINNIQQLPPGGIYTFAGFETFTVYLSYSSTEITVELIIFNGDVSPLLLTDQTILVEAVIYDAPFS